jgi:hypothetical protein
VTGVTSFRLQPRRSGQPSTSHEGFIYAFEKTGLVVTEQNQHLIWDKDLAEWDAAIEEYETKHQGRQA